MNPDVLEEEVLNIFGKLGCVIPPERIEAFHRISEKSSTVIAKFTKERLSAKLKCQEGTSKIKMEDSNLLGQNKHFINRSLCPYYKIRWSKWKKLHSLGKIFNFYISGEAINIKVNENSSPLSIAHVDDFGKYFPGVNLSPPERSV